MLQVADFASIGTNDLTQYTMAADRMRGSLAHLNDPWSQPFKLVGMTCDGACLAGDDEGTFGEHANRPVGVRRGSRGPSLAGAGRARVNSVDDAALFACCEGAVDREHDDAKQLAQRDSSPTASEA